VASSLAEPFRVLLPILRGQSASPLLAVADILAGGGGGKVLGLVESAGSTSMGGPGQRRLSFLRWLATADDKVSSRAPALPLDVLLTQDPARTAVEAVAESRVNLVVTEWPGRASAGRQRTRRLLNSLIAEPGLSLAMVRLGVDAKNSPVAPASVLVPIRGGPNAKLAVRIGGAISDITGAEMTVLHVQDSRHHPDRIRRETRAFRSLAETATRSQSSRLEVSSDSPVTALLEIAADYAMVVMGTRPDARAPSQLVAATMARLLQALEMTVILARSSEGSSWTARRAAGSAAR
jgi:nucleotide-binding universal stress UspA family protein